MGQVMKKRIMIVEDHNLLRQGLRSLVSTLPDFDVIAEARG
jgi:DNA-binding NarL/FixJ family response regulator